MCYNVQTKQSESRNCHLATMHSLPQRPKPNDQEGGAASDTPAVMTAAFESFFFLTKIQMIALWFLQSGSNNQSLSQCLQEGKLLVHGGHTFGKMKVLHIKFILLNFDSESNDFRLAKCLHCDKIVRRGKEGCSPRECTNSGMGSHMRSHHSGIAAQVLLFFEFTFCNLHCFQVQMQVQAAKATKVDTDLKDETVRGMMPLFKLRSKNDREQWRKMAFPVPETIQVGRSEYHKYTVDSAIMATVILDLQPFNQVNRWMISFMMVPI